MAIFEAMAAGKPVVATEVSGVPEAVQNERTGLLVRVGDVDAFAATNTPACSTGCSSHDEGPSRRKPRLRVEDE
jgi:hypothetical protein